MLLRHYQSCCQVNQQGGRFKFSLVRNFSDKFNCYFPLSQILITQKKKKKKEKRTMKNNSQLHSKKSRTLKQNKHKYLGFTCCVEQYNLKHLKEQSLRTFQCPVFQYSCNVTDFHPIQAWIFQTLLSQQLQHVVKELIDWQLDSTIDRGYKLQEKRLNIRLST